MESLVKRKAAQARKKEEGNSFRQLQETAMGHEEQGVYNLAEDTSLELQNSPLYPENKDGTAEVEDGTVDVMTKTDTSGEDIARLQEACQL